MRTCVVSLAITSATLSAHVQPSSRQKFDRSIWISYSPFRCPLLCSMSSLTTIGISLSENVVPHAYVSSANSVALVCPFLHRIRPLAGGPRGTEPADCTECSVCTILQSLLSVA